MRNPETARAIPELVREGVLTPAVAAPLLAAARGDVVSIRGELRALLGLGVALFTAGVGLFLKEHHDLLGPGAIAALLTLGATGTLLAVARRAPPFRWSQSEESDWIVDGLLLLAIGLLAADLAWIETQFTPLGAHWVWHLLVMSIVTGALAIRFDSTVAWTLALSTFAAWRGVKVSPAGFGQTLESGGDSIRWNLLFCAIVFAAIGLLAERFGRKAHFEPATTFLAALAAGISMASGLGSAAHWPLWALGLVGLGAGVATLAFRRRRLGLFALGALALYAGATRFLFEIPGSYGFGCFWFAASTLGAILTLVHVHRRFQAAKAT